MWYKGYASTSTVLYMVERACTHTLSTLYFNRKYKKCLNYKPHPKIAWLIESGGNELHDENKSTILLSLSYLPRTMPVLPFIKERTSLNNMHLYFKLVKMNEDQLLNTQIKIRSADAYL